MSYSNIHTHSDFSDGKFSPEEMLSAAIEKGLCSYGVSDHSDTPCDQSYCMKLSRYDDYTKTLLSLKEKYADKIDFFIGLEKDYYTDNGRIPEKLDYLIGSVHYIEKNGIYFAIDESKAVQYKCINEICGGDKIEMAKRYFDNVAKHSQISKYDIQGHFDVITKYGVFDDAGDEYKKIALDALDEVLKNVPFIELNTGGIYRGYRKEPYPQRFLLERIFEKGGKIMINGDSHDKVSIDFYFDEAIALLKEIGFDSIWQLRKEGFVKAEI